MSSQAKKRIKQVFEYLKALNDQRNPAVRQIKEHSWHFWLDALPDHPNVELRKIQSQPSTELNIVGELTTQPFVFRVRRPTLSPPPSLPPELNGWLQAGWDDPEKEAKFQPIRNDTDRKGETITARFTDSLARHDAFDWWKPKHQEWRQAELVVRQAMAVFEKLYALHGKLERESESFDLVIADGILSWQRPEGSIYHPLLIQRVQLEFDSNIPEFRIVNADTGCELYTTLFQTIPETDPGMLASRRQELDDGSYHPLSLDASAFLQGFANSISSQGTFLNTGRPEQGCGPPTIGRGPVLFLRSRKKGFGTAIEQVVKSVESRGDFCDALNNIVGCDTPRAAADSALRSQLSERDVLFAKLSNHEQFRIADQLNRHGSVLVQGPPGTGKSHTIANVIGHLLAQGKSVLVTSHTTKALRVLRDHVPENLRPLCVSVLDSDLESREQLKQSVRTIASRLSQSDEYELQREADRLNRRRNELLDAQDRTREELRKARADEYRDIVYGGLGLAPSAAARKVAEGRGKHDWMPGPIALGEPLPLSPTEVNELYSSNNSTRPEDDQSSNWSFPPPAFVLHPDEFLLAIEAKLRKAENTLWQKPALLVGQQQAVQVMIHRFAKTLAEFRDFKPWQLAALDAGRDDAGTRLPWDELLAKIEKCRKLVAEAQVDLIKHRPEVIGGPPLEEQIKTAKEIAQHLHDGGELKERRFYGARTIRSSWQNAYHAWRVNGCPPVTAEEVTAIWRMTRINSRRAELAKFWDRLMAANGGPLFKDFHDEPEASAAQFASLITAALNWWKNRWLPQVERLIALGFNWNGFLASQPHRAGKHVEIHRSIKAVEAGVIGELQKAAKLISMLEAESKMETALKGLEPFGRREVVQLRRAMQSRTPEGFREAVAIYRAAVERQPVLMQRHELLGRLRRRLASGEPVAEEWAAAIQDRIGDHGKPQPPGDSTLAWDWRQLNDELERRGKVDLGELTAKIAAIQEELGRTTCELIDQRAWAAQVCRTSLQQRKALNGWLDTIRRIGKGTGIRVPQLREAQRLMKECQSAVPVWVMPLVRLPESFDFSEPCFDVVIIDEASQCDLMALLALTLARKVVIVGDDEQVSPLAVGEKQDSVDHLVKANLAGIPLAHLFDGHLSIYDLAKQSFSGLIRLREHFRCVPEIIQFSNDLCYQGEIKPLREASSSPIRPHVIPFRVEGSRGSNTKVNREEAWTVATLLAAAIEHPEYRGQTFGVISLLGDEQAFEIEQLLLKHISPDEYQRRRIVCGNSAHFQGDERHVMFLSMVDSPEDTPLRLNDRKEFKQRINVAASRARNQLWLVHSLDATNDLKHGDLRRRLIEHTLDPGGATRELNNKLSRTQSPFERDVLGYLVRAGYRAYPQWQVGSYQIDFVIEGGGKRLALECDGDRYHTLEKLPQDMERQAILERLGWRFIRIRGSSFFRDPEMTMQGVFKKLEELGIPPQGPEQRQKSEEDSLVSWIRRRASEIRAAWQENMSFKEEPPVKPPTQNGPVPPKPNVQGTFFPVVERGPVKSKPMPATDASQHVTRLQKAVAQERKNRDTPSATIEVTTPIETLYAALAKCDAAIDKGKDGSKVSAAIRGWYAAPGLKKIDGLLSVLDKSLFPAMFGTEPRSSRRSRLEHWRNALEPFFDAESVLKP